MRTMPAGEEASRYIFHSPTLKGRLPTLIFFLPNSISARFLRCIHLCYKLNSMRNHNFNRRDFRYRGDFRQYQEHRHRNRVFFGIAMAVVGVIFLLRALGLLPYFSIECSWPVILIVIGTFIGIKNNFRRSAWWILILIGIINLTPQFTIMGRPSSHVVWPAMIIIGGLAIAMRPRRDRCYPGVGTAMGGPGDMNTSINTDGNLNIDISFGGKKEVVTSKDFKGGLVSVTFAGCELNLTQADFSEPSVMIDFRVSFGGVEVIVPSHWDIQNDINPSFGSVEDARTIQTPTTNETRKTLILKGNCSFGSIEIKSY